MATFGEILSSPLFIPALREPLAELGGKLWANVFQGIGSSTAIGFESAGSAFAKEVFDEPEDFAIGIGTIAVIGTVAYLLLRK